MSGSERKPGPVVFVLVALLAILLAAVVFELGLQVYSKLVVYPQLDALLADRRHYLVKSDDPILGYELAPGYHVESEGKELTINRYGLREDSDDLFQGRSRLAILGDSVVMSFGHSQADTIDALLEDSLRRAGDDTAVLNFGVGGYAFSELARFLELKNDVYHVGHVVYLLNPNDYARRDTLYEGADNGTYRLYYRPLFKTRWFIGKALYRYHKGFTREISPDWYHWMYRGDGNAQHGRDAMEEMNGYCQRSGCQLAVVLYPVGSAYTESGYALDDMYGEISAFLESRGIPHLSPVDAFAASPDAYFDNTDHLTPEGNRRLVERLHAFLGEIGAVAGGGAPPAQTSGVSAGETSRAR